MDVFTKNTPYLKGDESRKDWFPPYLWIHFAKNRHERRRFAKTGSWLG